MVASQIDSSLILNEAELGIRQGALHLLTKRPLTIWQAVLNYYYLRPCKNRWTFVIDFTPSLLLL